MKMRMKTAGAVCGLMMAAAASVGFGQYNRSVGGVQQVQPQGNALDASPQVGSGGSNMPISGYVPINANNYVTGNVGGLKSFNQPQTTVVNVNGVNVVVTNPNAGTQSPYEFRGSTGDNPSFTNWIRESSGGLQTTPTSAANAFYLPSSTVSTSQGNLYSSPYGSGFDTALVPRSSINPSGGAGAAGQYSGILNGGLAVQQFSAQPTNAGGLAGNSASLTSPLFAGRVSGTPLSVDLGTNSVNQNNPALGNPNPGNNANTGTRMQPTNGNPNGSNTGAPTGAAETEEERQMREKLQKPSDLSSVSRVDARVGGQLGGRVEGQSSNVQNANVLPEGAMLAERSKVNDTYRMLANELEKAEAAAREKAAVAKNTGTKGTKPQDQKDETVAGAQLPDSDTRNRPSGKGKDSAEQKDEGTVSGQWQSTDPTKPGYRPKSMPPRMDEMTTEELQAGKSVPKLKSFGSGGPGATVTPFDELMTKAEGLLKEGKYLDAANAYQTAMLQQPDNPLVVLGRANAELGAGMYESAASDLKFIFTRKPELITVKYALDDYIPPQRQHQLIADLTELSKGKGVGNTAEFLLCYLDYNTGRDIELQQELGRWNARPWKDAWLNTLRRAFGSGGE